MATSDTPKKVKLPQPGQGAKEIQERYVNLLKEKVKEMVRNNTIEYAEGFIRDVSSSPTMGHFTVEIDKFLGEKWFMSTPLHLTFNLIKGITPESTGKRVKISLELLDNPLDEPSET